MTSQKARRESFKKQIRQAGPVRFQTLKYRIGGAKLVVAAIMHLDGENVYHMGLAFCSEHDRFDKLKGQVIALGRLVKDPIEFQKVESRPVKWSVAAIAVYIAGSREIRSMEGVKPEDLV